MVANAKFPNVLGAGWLALCVAGCATAQPQEAAGERPAPAPVAPAPADAPEPARDPAQISRDYEKAARSAPPREAAGLLIAAAEAAVEAGDLRRADRLVDQVPRGELEPQQLVRLQLLRADSELRQGRPFQALRALPETARHAPRLAARVEELRAEALFALGDPATAVRALVERERFLTPPAEIARNHDRIWERLRATALNRNVLARAESYDDEVHAWVELALLVGESADPATLEDWRRRNPEHPGVERLGLVLPADARAVAQPFYDYRGRGGEAIALLLPLSGAFAVTGEAVRDGFLSAYYRAGGREPVRIYDAGPTTDTSLAAYQQALADGAGFVVGPLRKEGVAAIAQLGQPPAPVLALNYLDVPGAAPFNFFQFGLAPEDEARAVAEHAVAAGLRRAVVLLPSTDWGQRTAAAFERRLGELGGQVLEAARYAQGDRDFSEAIQGLFNLDLSRQRHAALVSTLGVKSEFEPRRRDDVDFVFFGARLQDARLIWPQFRFHRAADLPAYTTSAAYDGGTEPELAGVRLCDMPWMLGGNSALGAVREEAAGLGSLKSHPRLFAFGHDAYQLVVRIQRGELRGGESLAAASGTLGIGAGNAITRGLQCAVLQGGSPRPLEPAAP